MLTGVWKAHDSAITRNVTQSECMSPGSSRTACQLSSPVSWISPRPSQVVKLSHRTPTSGTTAKATKNASAGRASHPSEPPRPFLPGAPWRRSERAHLPMTAFMFVANSCGVIDSWNSLAMLSSSTSAAVGLSAWSQDWANVLALTAMP